MLLIALALAYGAAAGALVPRAAYRMAVDAGEPWRGTCPGGHPIRSWIGLARCPDCPGPYGTLTGPVLFTALACGALAWAVGPHPELAVWLLCAPVAALLFAVDRAVYRLPDVLTLPLAAAAAGLLGLAALAGGAGSWVRALLGGLALGGAFLLLHLIHPGGMAFGDVKLALPLGIALGWYGWDVLFAGVFAGFILGALYGAGLMLVRRVGRKAALPFGPFMLIGAHAGLLLGGLAAS